MPLGGDKSREPLVSFLTLDWTTAALFLPSETPTWDDWYPTPLWWNTYRSIHLHSFPRIRSRAVPLKYAFDLSSESGRHVTHLISWSWWSDEFDGKQRMAEPRWTAWPPAEALGASLSRQQVGQRTLFSKLLASNSRRVREKSEQELKVRCECMKPDHEYGIRNYTYFFFCFHRYVPCGIHWWWSSRWSKSKINFILIDIFRWPSW